MKHGRKEQLSITINHDVADDFYQYMEDNNFLYKNQAIETLLKKAFLFIKFQEKYDENKLKIFKRGFDLAADIAVSKSTSRPLKKMIKQHYSALEELLSDFCQQSNIP